MECTQKLDYIEEEANQRDTHDTVGSLGINGECHPIKLGINKVGRDPSICTIVINRNSLSRQHAVINILSNTEFQVMDLGSRNKTKVNRNTLRPYLPHPLKHGDAVQFGDIFGVFNDKNARDDDFPATQDIAIPDTPVIVPSREAAGRTCATIPESPDKDDSIVMNSQPVMGPPTKTIVRKMFTKLDESNDDSVFWNTSSTSPSVKFNLDESVDSVDSRNKSLINMSETNELGESIVHNTSKSPNIHELETQVPSRDNSFYNAETQIPEAYRASIYSTETQLGDNLEKTSSIYDSDTQLPERKSNNQTHEMATWMVIPEKDDNTADNSIHSVETQVDNSFENKENLYETLNSNKTCETLKDNSFPGDSDDELFFEEVDEETYNVEAESQIIAIPEPGKTVDTCEPPKICLSEKTISEDIARAETLVTETSEKSEKNNEEEDETDCETDCEDEADIIERLKNIVHNRNAKTPSPSKKHSKSRSPSPNKLSDISKKSPDKESIPSSHIITNYEDQLTQILLDDDVQNDQEKQSNYTTSSSEHDRHSSKRDEEFDQLATQVLHGVSPSKPEVLPQILAANIEQAYIDEIADMPTQIITNEPKIKQLLNENDDFENMMTQVLPESPVKNNNDVIVEPSSPFKIPKSVVRKRNKAMSETDSPKKAQDSSNINKYYDNTQELLCDLLSQEVEVVGHSQASNITGEEFTRLDTVTSCELLKDKSVSTSVSLCTQQIRNVLICPDPMLISPEKKSSKSSETDMTDLEGTPAKKKKSLFDFDLPNSQEIHSALKNNSSKATEDSSDSECETQQYSEEITPIVYRKKESKHSKLKTNLLKALESDVLPSRVMTRVRKPTTKGAGYNAEEKILKSRLVSEQEESINEDIIQENLEKIKQKILKTKGKKISPNTSKEQFGVSVLQIQSPVKHEAVVMPVVKLETDDISRYESKRSSRATRRISSDVVVKEKAKIVKNETGSIRKRDAKEGKGDSHAKATRSKSKPEKKKQGLDDEIASRASTKKRTIKLSDDEQIEKKPTRRGKAATSKPKSKEIQLAIEPREGPVTRNRQRRETMFRSSSNMSTIFDMSGSLSPRRKTEEMPAPPKRSKYGSPTHCLRRNASRAGALIKKNVMFTAYKDERMVNVLEKLGATIVNDPNLCSVVVTPNIRRTVKLLCAIGLGKPIVGENWLKACKDTHMFVDPWLYLLNDTNAERRFKFSLNRTLIGERNFLRGLKVSATPSVLPTPNELKAIVECNGGQWGEGGSLWLVVSTLKDKYLWPALTKRGATLVSTEAILGGVFNQQLDIEANVLRSD